MLETNVSYIPRDSYVQRIRPYIDSHIIKALTGQRRVGKSYILYQLIDELRKTRPGANIVYVNTEFAEFARIKDHDDLYQFVSSRFKAGSANYVFIDEIQEISRFEQALRSFFAEETWDIYITGSNARLLSGDLATYLAGRYVQIPVHPLAYAEFLTFYGFENSSETLGKYLRIGGMPYLASLLKTLPHEPGLFPEARSEALAFEYLKNLYESILLRDVVARENIRNVRFLENLTAYLADNTGSLFSANNISKYLKNQKINMPVQTVISYLGALERSFLVHKVQRADVAGLKIFEIGEKYYFEDPGLRNVCARTAPPSDIAKLVEQAVYLFLVQRGYTVHVGKNNAVEIDFAAEKQGARLYVQAAWHIHDEDTLRREYGGLEGIADHFPKYVVTMDDGPPRQSPRGIRWMNLKDFLVTEL
ncbi:MAG: ATP-binding protein [Treponema sp.]|jgi:predicted AAA+ superfamily ATPase|nr:ATP-binding protein [Treponema sp.]